MTGAPLALDDDAMAEVSAAAALVPYEQRNLFLQLVAAALRGQKVVGAGSVHRAAYAIAQTMVWDAAKEAS